MNKFLLASLILVFPIAGYFLLQTGKNHFRPLPFFGPKTLSGNFHTLRGKKIPDTMYYTIPDFTLINQDSAVFSEKELDSGTIYTANFFFTRCPDICPKVNAGIDSLVRQFKIHPDVKFLSISVDPAYDQPSVLKAYAKKMGADRSRWSFLTGNRDYIFNLARNIYKVNAIGAVKDSNLIHSPYIILVDGKRHIRGYYDGTREEDLKKLRDEIIVLRLEVMRKVTDIIQH